VLRQAEVTVDDIPVVLVQAALDFLCRDDLGKEKQA
jgi:hypothetical protein